jgi:uncharacterized protein YoxC
MAELGVLLIGASFLLLALAVIPTLIELRRTMAEVKSMVAMLNTEFVPLLREMRAVSEHINALADQAEHGVERASELFDAAGRLGHTLQRVQSVLEHSPIVTNTLVVGAGVRAAIDVLRQRFQRSHGVQRGSDGNGR